MNTEQQQSHLTSDCVGDASKTALAVQPTPGPWTVRSVPVDDEPMGKFVQHYIEPHVAEVFYVTEDGAATAHLIAAAPDLLGAAKQASFALRELLPNDPDAQMTVRILAAAIAKAESRA